jgi:hypothetical protein
MSAKCFTVALMALVVALLTLNMLQVRAARHLVQINDGLLADQAAARYSTVSDAHITAWHQPDGSILLIVNGYYEHTIPDGCRRF